MIQDDCSDRHGVFDREGYFHSEDNKRICYLVVGEVKETGEKENLSFF